MRWVVLLRGSTLALTRNRKRKTAQAGGFCVMGSCVLVFLFFFMHLVATLATHSACGGIYIGMVVYLVHLRINETHRNQRVAGKV